MIVRLSGKLIEKNINTVTVDVQGFCYEVFVPVSLIERVEETLDKNGNINLIIYHYLQLEPSKAFPVMLGFTNEIERDFFAQFITVSGIGPRAAIKAISKPISEIANAIDTGDLDFLKSLPGIGLQRAKEIVAKLQGKVGRFGLIQDKKTPLSQPDKQALDWQEEALSVLIQLQYKKQEAMNMIRKALDRSKDIQTTEELLNEIYKQRVKM